MMRLVYIVKRAKHLNKGHRCLDNWLLTSAEILVAGHQQLGGHRQAAGVGLNVGELSEVAPSQAVVAPPLRLVVGYNQHNYYYYLLL